MLTALPVVEPQAPVLLLVDRGRIAQVFEADPHWSGVTAAMEAAGDA